jgi:hypothetical protein
LAVVLWILNFVSLFICFICIYIEVILLTIQHYSPSKLHGWNIWLLSYKFSIR